MNWGKIALELFLVALLLTTWHVDFGFSFPAQSTPSSIAATIDAICLPPMVRQDRSNTYWVKRARALDGKSMPSRWKVEIASRVRELSGAPYSWIADIAVNGSSAGRSRRGLACV